MSDLREVGFVLCSEGVNYLKAGDKILNPNIEIRNKLKYRIPE